MPRSIPIIRLYGNLLVSIQIELSDRLIVELKDDIAREIRRSDVHGLVVEVSGVDLFDSFIARSIQDLAQIARFLGVRTILAGLNAGMAVTLVEMGMGLDGVQTALTLESALEMLARSRRREAARDAAPGGRAREARAPGPLADGGHRRADRAAERLLAAAAEDDDNDGALFAGPD